MFLPCVLNIFSYLGCFINDEGDEFFSWHFCCHLVARVGLHLCLRDLHMLKIVLKSFLLSCSDFCRNPLQMMLHIVQHCLQKTWYLSLLLMSFCKIFSSLLCFLTSPVTVSLIHGSFGLSDSFLVFRDVNLSIS